MRRLFPILLISGFVFQYACNKSRHSRRSVAEQSENSESNAAKSASNVPQQGLALVWKRYRALESGLMTGLSLTKDQVCTELGTNSCIDKVHLTVLGGNEPYQNGQYERAQNPSVLTAVAVDRVVLSACGKRLELDRAAGAGAQVFKFFALGAAKPNDDQVKQQAIELYHRLLAREPEAAELQAIAGFSASSVAADKLALSLCFAIGTSSENIFL